jgi:hypothetical protein
VKRAMDLFSVPADKMKYSPPEGDRREQ